MSRLVVIETPYRGVDAKEEKRNMEYAQACMKNSIERGETPMLSHLLYTQVLDDDIKEERNLGIDLGLNWLSVADAHIFYVDNGLSEGMYYALQQTLKRINPRVNFIEVNRSIEGVLKASPSIVLEFRKLSERIEFDISEPILVKRAPIKKRPAIDDEQDEDESLD